MLRKAVTGSQQHESKSVETLNQFFTEHPWVTQGGYMGMFVLLLVDGGPVTTALGALAARVGIFDPFVIFLLVVLGNFIPDMLFYAVGAWGRTRFIEVWKKFGITRKRVEAIEGFYQDHPWSTLFAVKMIPFIPPAGLAAAGAAGMPLKVYAFRCLVIILPTSALFFATGYFAGEAYIRTVKYQVYTLMAIGIGILIFGRVYRKLAEKLGYRINPKLGNLK